jgi:hypothetical protein
LKTLEKLNSKAIRKSLEKGKPNSAQVSPLNLARARPCPRAPMPDRRAPPVGANLSALASSLSLSLAALWGRPVGAVSLACARSPSLCPVVPTCQPSLTSRPRSPRRGRAHVRAFSSHIHALTPLLSPMPCLPTSPRSFVPSAKPSRPLSRSAQACRELCHRSSSTAACSVATVASAPRPVPQ